MFLARGTPRSCWLDCIGRKQESTRVKRGLPVPRHGSCSGPVQKSNQEFILYFQAPLRLPRLGAAGAAADSPANPEEVLHSPLMQKLISAQRLQLPEEAPPSVKQAQRQQLPTMNTCQISAWRMHLPGQVPVEQACYPACHAKPPLQSRVRGDTRECQSEEHSPAPVDSDIVSR